MFQSIWDDVKREFRYGNMVTRIIILNCAVFIFVNIVKLILHIPGSSNSDLFDKFIRFFAMPRDTWYFIKHPWTIVTAGFLHVDFTHIFWNMLTFYWFGRIVGDLLGNHRVLPLYLTSVIVGNLVFYLIFNLTPYGNYSELPFDAFEILKASQHALGASAAVMAMLACATYVAPDYIFNILLVGPVKLKYIALVIFLLDLIGIADNNNTGGHFAHLGGAAFGLLYASQLRKGIDLGKPINKLVEFVSGFFSNQPKKDFKYQKGEKTYTKSEKTNTSSNTSTKGSPRSDTNGDNPQEKLDLILDKIKEKGYESLTKEEKEFLFNASKK
jgi:membrane associated rhomboid family serine protease